MLLIDYLEKIIFSAQLWSYDDETNILRNKNNGWVYLDKTWKIPTLNNLEGGYIEEISSGKVLGLKDDAYHNGTEVVLENKKEASEKLQIWIRTWWWNGTDNSYFTLYAMSPNDTVDKPIEKETEKEYPRFLTADDKDGTNRITCK